MSRCAHIHALVLLRADPLVQLSLDTHDALRRVSTAPTPSRHPSPWLRLPCPHPAPRRCPFGLSRDRMAPALRALHARPVCVPLHALSTPKVQHPSDSTAAALISVDRFLPASCIFEAYSYPVSVALQDDEPSTSPVFFARSMPSRPTPRCLCSSTAPRRTQYRRCSTTSPFASSSATSRRPAATRPRSATAGEHRAWSYSRRSARWCSHRRAKVPARANEVNVFGFGMRMLRRHHADADDSACDSYIEGARYNQGS
jgi:hypothetical protein